MGGICQLENEIVLNISMLYNNYIKFLVQDCPIELMWALEYLGKNTDEGRAAIAGLV